MLSPPMPWIGRSKNVDMSPARITGGLLLPNDSAGFLPRDGPPHKENGDSSPRQLVRGCNLASDQFHQSVRQDPDPSHRILALAQGLL